MSTPFVSCITCTNGVTSWGFMPFGNTKSSLAIVSGGGVEIGDISCDTGVDPLSLLGVGAAVEIGGVEIEFSNGEAGDC